MSWSREEMVRRAAREIQPGSIVNLGIGMPTEVANNVSPEAGVVLQTENGLLGMGPFPYEDEVDALLVNAGKQTVTALPGASIFDSSLSFAMIRGGRVDLAILGGLEVAANGDLANWTVPGKLITGMGGAMDLAAGAKRLVVLQSHTAKDGTSKLVTNLGLPLTALGCVNLVITELGAFAPAGDHFLCLERAPGVSGGTAAERTGARLVFSAAGAAPDFDPAMARRALAHDQGLVDEVVEVFLEQLPELFAKLEVAAERNDLNTLAAEAHSLKGSILAAAARPLSEAAVALERQARATETEGARAAAARLREVLQSLAAVLTRLK